MTLSLLAIGLKIQKEFKEKVVVNGNRNLCGDFVVEI
jgi:hypothetical protein